jgi:FixJ family two-component response regulator
VQAFSQLADGFQYGKHRIVVDDDGMVRTALLRLLGLGRHEGAGLCLGRRIPAGSRCPRRLLPAAGHEDAGSDGFEVVRRLEQRGDAIPVIFISGYGTIPATVQAMKAGAHEFLTKPVEDERLLGAVRDALALASRQLHLRVERPAPRAWKR